MGTSLELRRLRRRATQIDATLTQDMDRLEVATADAVGALSSSLASKANSASLGALSTVVAGKADAASVPTAADHMPPSVADTGAKGAQTTQYALADHTHQSSVQRVRMQVAGAAGLVTWTFTNPMSAAPVVTATAETPSGATYVNVATIVEGSVTTTQAVIRVAKIAGAQSLAGVLTGILSTLNIFAPAPAGVWVQCVARRP